MYAALLEEKAHSRGLVLLITIRGTGLDILQHLQSGPGCSAREGYQDERQGSSRSAQGSGERKPADEEDGKQKRARDAEIVCLCRENGERENQQHEQQQGALKPEAPPLWSPEGVQRNQDTRDEQADGQGCRGRISEVKEVAKSNCISILDPGTGRRRRGLRAMENDSRSRALTRGMLKKAMERGMVLPPHR